MARSRRRAELRNERLDRAIDDLVTLAAEEWGTATPGASEQVREMLVTSLRLLRDPPSSGDLLLINSTVKELRHAMRVFRDYETVRKIAVFGSARTGIDHPDWAQAQRFSSEMVRRGWMVITGAGGGIMEAAQGGAGRERSFGVNIRLPFEQTANDVIAGDRKCIHFRYFFTRKVTFVKNSHAIALFPGGFGTHDEGYEALTLIQTGKSEILPVVYVDEPGGSYWKDWDAYVRSHLHARGLISEPDLSLYRVVDDVGEAVDEVVGFYRNYHSSRYVRSQLVLRLRVAPDDEQLEALNESFADIVASGRIENSGPLPAEAGEAPGLPRLTLAFNRRSIGRLRQMIDRINAWGPGPGPGPGASPHEIVSVELSDAAEWEESDDT